MPGHLLCTYFSLKLFYINLGIYSATTILRYSGHIPLRSINPSKSWWFVNVYISASLSIGRMYKLVQIWPGLICM